MSPAGFLPTVLTSKSTYLGNGNVSSARLVIADAQLSDTAGFLFYLSNDGGTTWEAVTRNVVHTFSSTGGDVRYRIIGNPGETLSVRLSDGTDLPIKVEV